MPSEDHAAELVELDARERDAAHAHLVMRSISREYYEGIIRGCREQRLRLDQKAPAPMAPGLLLLWDSLTLSEKNLALRQLVAAATLTDDGLEVVFAGTGWTGMPVSAVCGRDGLTQFAH